MPSTHFDEDDPVGTSTGPSVVATIEANLQALRDAIIMLGGMPRWQMSVTAGTGTAAYPQYRYQTHYSTSAKKIRAEYTYSSGKVTAIAYDYTEDSWTTTLRIGTRTITYDGSNNVTATSWSDS